MVIVSACLLGVACRYDGKSKADPDLISRLASEGIVPVCPEQLGGLSTPRPAAEIIGGDGGAVLDGTACVMNREGCDVTENYLRGAEETLKLAKNLGVETAWLKSNSPSCGFGCIRRKGRLAVGNGVAAELLKRHGINVVCV